jgi:hypothetical protein
VRTSETPVHFNVTTRCYITEDSKLHIRRRENLKSRKLHINNMKININEPNGIQYHGCSGTRFLFEVRT